MSLGFDCGTYNLVTARRGDTPEEVKVKREVNAFLKIPLEDRFTFNMLKKSGVKLYEQKKIAYVLGEGAVKMAYTFGKDLARPMKDGTLNPEESESFEILKVMIHSLVGEIKGPKETVYYCVPADAVNAATNAAYHKKIIEQIFLAYNVNGKKIEAFSINEALALIYAELADRFYTGVGISFGSGMVNACVSVFSQSAAQFSIVGSGDWIDSQVAKVTNTPAVVVNQEKMKFDLLAPQTSPLERALNASYRILVENTVDQIKSALTKANLKVKVEDPFNIVLGGGVASPNGFEDLVREAIKNADFPIPVGEIIKPKDHLYAVARGCLCAAEQAN